MSQEIVYTSSPQGLKLGSRGFCTVASTPGMASSLAERLESLSGYRHLYPPQDPQARLNPIAWSYLLLTVGGRRYHVLSRIADAGLDYSQRSNKLAHHVALDTNELPPGGPAWCLAQNPFMLTAWNEPPRLLNSGRVPPRGEHPAQVCTAWQRMTGDAGWAGVLAQTAETKRDAYLLFSPGMDMLPLLVEALSLLPPARRWEVSFSTYVTRLPPGVECRWRCIVADSDEAIAARRAPGATVIDLTQRLGPAPAGPLVTAARTGQIAFAPPPRAVEATPLPGVRRSPLAGIDTTPDADLLSDGDYRLADDRTLPVPAPPVQLRMSTPAATSGRARRLTLLVGGALGLLLLLGGGYAATKYLGRAIASLPSKPTDSAPDPKLEQQRTAAHDAIEKWAAAVGAFNKETEAPNLTEAVISALEDEGEQATKQVEKIAELKVPDKIKDLENALASYRDPEKKATDLSKKEDLKGETAETIKNTHTKLLESKNALQAALASAKSAADEAQKLRSSLEQQRQRADQQHKIAEQLQAAQKALLEQQEQLPTTNESGEIRSQLAAAIEQSNRDFGSLDAWSSKLAVQREKFAELLQKLPSPPDEKLLPESQAAINNYEPLKEALAKRVKELSKSDPGEFLTKLPDNFLIDGAFPSNGNREVGKDRKHDGHLLSLSPAAAERFAISVPDNQGFFVESAPSAPIWKIVKGQPDREFNVAVGSFTISQGYLTWTWDREFNESIHEIIVKFQSGSKARLVRLLTQPPQQHSALELVKDSEKQWRLQQPVITLATTNDLKIIVHRIDFAGLPDGFQMVQGRAEIKPEDLKTEIGLQRKDSKPERPRFAVVLNFLRQSDKTSWKLRAAPLTLLVVPINEHFAPQELKPEHYLALSDDVLAKFVLAPDSSKGKLLNSMGEFPEAFRKNEQALKDAEKIQDGTERNKEKERLKNEHADIQRRKKEREAVSEQVFPSDLYHQIKEKPQAFIDELAGSIKIHMSIVRQEKDQPSLTIAEFGDVPTTSILRVPATASAAASK